LQTFCKLLLYTLAQYHTGEYKMSEHNHSNTYDNITITNKLYFEENKESYQNEMLNTIDKEQSKIGYYSLPEQNIDFILDYSNKLSDSIEHIAIIGIGGSSLGAKAIYEFIKPTQTLKRELHFFESTDPINIKDTLRKIDLNKTHFLVISKSGTTIETFAIFKYIYSLHNNMQSYTFITDSGSKLEKYAHKVNAQVFNLPTSVGGRFSVLSTVGLIPLALCGIDIQELLLGAKKIKDSFFHQGYIKNTLLKKASFYAKNYNQYDTNCIFAYSESLQSFNEWYVQLWGESLGKRQKSSMHNVGFTPIGLIGPRDQHSFLQLLSDGTRNKSVTFIKIENFNDNTSIPDISLPHLESLDTLNNIPFSQLINMQCDAIAESLEAKGDIPIDIISLPKIDAHTIGGLIYYYELLTSLVASCINIDAYDQPGVEAGKKILQEKLDKRASIHCTHKNPFNTTGPIKQSA